MPAHELRIPVVAGRPVHDREDGEVDLLSGIHRFRPGRPASDDLRALLHALDYALALLDAPALSRAREEEPGEFQRVRDYTRASDEAVARGILGRSSTARLRFCERLQRCWACSSSTAVFLDLLRQLGLLDTLGRICERSEPMIPFPADERVSLVSPALVHGGLRLPLDSEPWTGDHEAAAAFEQSLAVNDQELGAGQRIVYASPELPVTSGERLAGPTRVDVGEMTEFAFVADPSLDPGIGDDSLSVVLRTTRALDAGWQHHVHPIPAVVNRRPRQTAQGPAWTVTGRCNCLEWLAQPAIGSAQFAVIACTATARRTSGSR
jgi:hypothetical protein